MSGHSVSYILFVACTAINNFLSVGQTCYSRAATLHSRYGLVPDALAEKADKDYDCTCCV